MSKGIVFYTDGGSKDHEYGFGVHGYLYLNTPAKRGIGAPGWIATQKGYHVKDDTLATVTILSYVDIVGYDVNKGTNNLAEAKAILYALKETAKLRHTNEDITDLLILSDSEVAIRWVVEGIPFWQENEWKRKDGSDVPYQDVFVEIAALQKSLSDLSIAIDIQWIEAHAGDLGNEKADTLAGIGINLSMQIQANQTEDQIITHSDPTGYWNTEVERHPLLDFQRMYYYSLSYQPGTYYLSSYDYGNNKKLEEYEEVKQKDKMFGSPHSLLRYAIVKLNTPDPDIEAVRDRQKLASYLLNHMVMLKMETLFNKEVAPYLRQYGNKVLSRRSQNTLSLSFLRKKTLEVTLDRSFAGLSMQALDEMTRYEQALENHISQQPMMMDQRPITLIDITDVFYETTVVKEKTKVTLRPEFVVGYKSLSYDLPVEQYTNLETHKKVTLALGHDLPSRNALNRLAHEHVRIYLCAYDHGTRPINRVQFFGLVSHPEGHAAYISSYSNYFYLKDERP